MDQANYLFDNQYNPDILDKAFQKIRATTWDHCIKTQRAACQQYLFGGPVQDFTQDEIRNNKLGFKPTSYAHFIPYKLVNGNQKYVLEHFIRGKETFTLREMLNNPIFEDQYIFHLADYVFMNVKIQIVQNGSWLIIDVDTEDGLTSTFMETLMNNYSDEYSENRWFLERRFKVSYAYKESFLFNLVQEGNRIYFDKFEEYRNYLSSDVTNDWKVCIGDRSDNPSLMRMTCSHLYYDGDRPYLELSDTFMDYIKDTTFKIHCFIFNEAQKAGYTISPNYIGPTGFLFTVFDEYLATIEAARLKVVCMDLRGGWTATSGVDRMFGPIDDVIVVGFTTEDCFVAVPTKSGVSPIHPSNFRIWEYDYERDTLGRMVSHDMSAVWPNIYLYRMKSDTPFLYIEWFRDDTDVVSIYDDFSLPYRQYIGTDFYGNALKDLLPDVVDHFKPHVSKYNETDFVRHLLLESSHDYRIHEMKELLKETGLHYDILFEMLAKENQRFTTYVYRLKEQSELLLRIRETGQLQLQTSYSELRPYDLYIDGIHIVDTHTHWAGPEHFDQAFTIPLDILNDDSIIILDLYEPFTQVHGTGTVRSELYASNFPQDYPFDLVSGSDVVITDDKGLRIAQENITYGVYAKEYIIQIPLSVIHWDELGISPDDERIQSRIGISPGEDFKALTFSYVTPLETSYVHLKTRDHEKVSTNSLFEHFKVRDGQVLISSITLLATYDALPLDENNRVSANRFGRRLRKDDLLISIKNKNLETIMAYNANVWRMTRTCKNLKEEPVLRFARFCGADDPYRLLGFVNGILQPMNVLNGQIPDQIDTDFILSFSGSYTDEDRGEIVYLPFPVDRFTFTSGEKGWTSLAGTGIMCISKRDMIFVKGKRIPTEDIVSVTNQLVICPTEFEEYTILRVHRDSNIYDFQDIVDQCFFDKLFRQSPGFADAYLYLFSKKHGRPSRWPSDYGTILEAINDHTKYTNCDEVGAHPIEAISGLEEITAERIDKYWRILGLDDI